VPRGIEDDLPSYLSRSAWSAEQNSTSGKLVRGKLMHMYWRSTPLPCQFLPAFPIPTLNTERVGSGRTTEMLAK